MNTKPNVLIFDDEIEWAKLIKEDIEDRYSVTIVKNAEEWNSKIAPSYWAVIIVDVQILGSAKLGFEIAEDAILTLGIKSPVIVITNKVDVQSIKKSKGNLFFAYHSKTDPNFSENIQTDIDRAYASTKKLDHVCNLLREIAEEQNILNTELSSGYLEDWKSELQIFSRSLSSSNITFGSLLELMCDEGCEDHHKGRIEKLLWDIIRESRESLYR